MRYTANEAANARMITTEPVDLMAGDRRVYRPLSALAAAEHAVAVYQRPQTYSSEALRAGFRGGTVMDRGCASVGVAHHTQVIVVAVRGSDDRGDWIANGMSLSFMRRQWSPPLLDGVRVGWAWRRQAKALAWTILERVQLVRGLPGYAETPVVVTGHSLGGACVPLLVAYLVDRGVRVDSAYLIDPPRPGDRAFAEWYDRVFTRDLVPTWTIVNTHHGVPDLVSRVPLKRLGHRHVGEMVILDGEMRHHGDRAWSEFRARNPVGWWRSLRIVSRLSDGVRAHLSRSILATMRGQAKQS